jgi:hypothetical protein
VQTSNEVHVSQFPPHELQVSAAAPAPLTMNLFVMQVVHFVPAVEKAHVLQPPIHATQALLFKT